MSMHTAGKAKKSFTGAMGRMMAKKNNTSGVNASHGTLIVGGSDYERAYECMSNPTAPTERLIAGIKVMRNLKQR